MAVSFLSGFFWLFVSILSFVIGFFAFYFYWSLDRKTELFDKNCREDIKDHDEFRGLQRGSQTKLISTSDTRTSKAISILQKLVGKLSDKPHKVVVVGSQSIEERKKEVIFERCKDVKGKNVIQPELVAALRNFFAYKLALLREGRESDIAHHFRERFEQYEFSGRIMKLADTDHYDEISLVDDHSRIKPLDDVFLEIVEGAQRHCVSGRDNLAQMKEDIEQCSEFMMWLFFSLYMGEAKGVVLEDGLEQDHVENQYRVDVREQDIRGIGWCLVRRSRTVSSNSSKTSAGP